MSWTAYVPTTWTAGTAITTTLLAHMETQYTNIIGYLAYHTHNSRYYLESLSDSYFWNANNDGAGSTMNADMLGGQHAAQMSGGLLAGVIGFWWGTSADFSGELLTNYPNWHVADGVDGSENLTGLFPFGASNAGDTGPTYIYPVKYQIGNEFITPYGLVTITGVQLSVYQSMHSHGMNDAAPSSHGNYNCPGGSPCTSVAEAGVLANITQYACGVNGTNNAHTHSASFVGTEVNLSPPAMALIPIQYGNYNNGVWTP